jgi:hypothetical protein
VSHRETLAAAGVYLLLAVVFVAPALVPGRTLASGDYLWSAAPWSHSAPAGVPALGSNPELVDPATVFEPMEQYEASTFPTPPLWDPYIMAGRPLLADAQSAPYSLYTLPAYVLPFWRSLAVSALMKLFVAAFGTFLFARLALGIGFAGGLLAGAVFAFGLNMIAWLPWPLTSVWSFLPWLLLLVDRLVRRPSRLAVCGLAVVVALQYLGGHPESSFQTLSVTVLFGGFRVVQRWRREGRTIALRTTALAAGALLLGTALAALVLVPFAELLFHSSDISQRSGQPYPVTPAKYLLGILLPDYWGRPTQTELSGFLVQRAFYAGTLTLLLVICALALRRDAERILFAVVGLLAVAVVVGLQPFTFLIRLIPGYSVTYNTRLVIFYLFAVAVLAGYGLDDLFAGRRIALPRRPRLSAAWIWGAVVVAPVVVLAARGEVALHLIGRAIDVAWGFARMPGPTAPGASNVIRMASVLEWLTFAALATGLVLLRLRRRLGPVPFAAVAIVLVCADLFRAGIGENPAIPISHATQPATGAIRYLQARTPARFVAESSTGTVPITPDTAIRYRLYDARGYDLPLDKRYDALWRRTVSNATLLIPPTQLAPIDARSLRTFDLLGVSDIVQAPSDAPLREPGLRLAYSGADARIYSNARALPRAAVVGAITRVGSDAAALDAITASGFDPARSAITEQPIAGLPAAPATDPAGQAQITTYDPERVVVRAHADRSGLLVLSDLAYPGWTATVDGHPARIYTVDYLLRGIRLPPGSHTVQMSYEPASWRFGWITSLLALAVVAVLAVTGFTARRSAAPA